MPRVPSRRLPAVLAVVALPVALLLTGPAAAAQREPALLAAGGARVETAAGAVALPRRPGLAVSTVADLGGADGRWVAAGTEEHGDAMRLALFTGTASTGSAAGGDAAVQALPSPRTSAPIVASPQPVHAGGTLRGVAWLEGSAGDRLAVRYAPWTGAGWGDAETIAARGPGSQLAVSAAVLDGGDVLAAWSRFDGSDDEIYWSVRHDGAWSAPQRLGEDDAVPDITPAVTAIPGGALAAWAGFDGHGYRVYGARFDGTAWSAPRSLGADRHRLPELRIGRCRVGRRRHRALLVRTDRPRGWSVIELDAELTPLRRAHTAASADGDAVQRPVLVNEDGAGPVLRWPGDASGPGERRALRWRAAAPRPTAAARPEEAP